MGSYAILLEQQKSRLVWSEQSVEILINSIRHISVVLSIHCDRSSSAVLKPVYGPSIILHLVEKVFQ